MINPVFQISFETPEALFLHRETEEHKLKLHLDRKASYCQVCRKKFTSAAQLKEHVKGKVHSETLENLRGKWNSKSLNSKVPGRSTTKY